MALKSSSRLIVFLMKPLIWIIVMVFQLSFLIIKNLTLFMCKGFKKLLQLAYKKINKRFNPITSKHEYEFDEEEEF